MVISKVRRIFGPSHESFGNAKSGRPASTDRRSVVRAALLGGRETAGDFSPIDYVPKRGHVVGTTVLVVEVVGMFPHIQAENRGATFGQGRVLIGATFEDELSLVDGQPRPAAAESGRGRIGEFFLEVVQATEFGIDGLGQLASRSATAAVSGRRQNRPEQRVIRVTAAVVANNRADGFWNGRQSTNEVFD